MLFNILSRVVFIMYSIIFFNYILMEFRNLIDQNLNENFFAISAIKIK